MRGDVYWVDVAGDGRTIRPFLVLQSDALNDVVSSTIALPLTLAPQKAGPPLTIELAVGETGIDQLTWVRVTKPQTLPLNRFAARIGSISPSRLGEITDAFRQVLDLD